MGEYDGNDGLNVGSNVGKLVASGQPMPSSITHTSFVPDCVILHESCVSPLQYMVSSQVSHVNDGKFKYVFHELDAT